jgi:heavy metal sensor kinase
VSLPIRARLTAWYAVLLAAIMVGLGAFIFLQLRSDLRDTIDRDTRASAGLIAQGYGAEGADEFFDVSQAVLPGSGSAAQVLDDRGRVLLTYGDAAAGRPLVPAGARAAALAGRRPVVDVTLGSGAEPAGRAVVASVRRHGRLRVVVAAESLREVEESVERVLILLLLAGPAALVATALGGWWLASKALRPVKRMTAQAAGIEIDRLHERIAVPRTVDEIGYLAVTLNAMLDRLERGVKDKHRLISDASHELRTPLAVMRSELDVSLRGDELTPAARAVLESAREEVDRLSRMVDNLLTLAQVDEGRLEILTARVPLNEAIQAAVRPLRPLAAAKQVRLVLDGETSDAHADPQRLHLALTNLIENAIKFAHPGGEVHVSVWRRRDEVGVTVTDDGPGIPPDARAHVFDRFYRADPARGRDIGGSGLGLAICREIASAHGGRVWVDSEEGEGSAFSLALPAVPAGADEDVSAPA